MPTAPVEALIADMRGVSLAHSFPTLDKGRHVAFA